MSPANLQGNINSELHTIEIVWNKPSTLINNSIHNYNILLNISLEMSEYVIYEVTTNATSLKYNLSRNGIDLCNISSVRVNVQAHNKLGIGEPAEKMIHANVGACDSVVEPSMVDSSHVTGIVLTSESSPSLKVGPQAPNVYQNNTLIINGTTL